MMMSKGPSPIYLNGATVAGKDIIMKIDLSECYEAWAEVLVEEILSHLDIPDHKTYETELCVQEMDEREIDIYFEYFDENLDEGGEEERGGWDSRTIRIRYWIDQEWPSFCVSYHAFEKTADGCIEHDDGAYKIVTRRGKAKCIPIQD